MHVLLQVPYGQHARQRFDLFVPDEAAGGALVLCLHGGWWSQGRHEDLRPLCLALAEHGIASATLGTRQFGDGPRSGVEIMAELREGTAKVLEEGALAGLDGRSLIPLGSGSGSLPALLLAGDPQLRARAAAACGVTPSVDHAEGMAPQLGKVLEQFGGANRHALSPIQHKPDGFAPLLLLHGDADAEVPAKLVHRFHLRVVEGGGESTLGVLTGAGHQFVEQPHERAGRAALERLIPFLSEHARPLDDGDPFGTARAAAERAT
jgi:fermentation-respiration switch protein FrsA (DUF1100 family)